MVTKKFNKHQEELIRVCCNSNLPIVVVGKAHSGKEELITLIEKLNPTRRVFSFTQFESKSGSESTDSIFNNLKNIPTPDRRIVDDLESSIPTVNTAIPNFENKVFISNTVPADLSAILGTFLKVDLFSQEGSEEINLRITDVTVDPHKATINLSDDVKNCLIYSDTNMQFKFNHKGRSVSQTKSFIDIANNNSYINDLSNLSRFIDTDYKLLDTIKCVGKHTTFEYDSLVIIDLRGLTLEPKKQEEQINSLLLLEEELERKVVVITDNNKLYNRLDTRWFNARYNYSKTE